MDTCIERIEDSGPDKIIDTSTLSLSIDNQGIATLQMSILKRNEVNANTSVGVTYTIGNKTFEGFLDSDTPRRLEGTEYIEHNIVAIGMVGCDAGGGGSGAPSLDPGNVNVPINLNPVGGGNAIKSNRTRPGG